MTAANTATASLVGMRPAGFDVNRRAVHWPLGQLFARYADGTLDSPRRRSPRRRGLGRRW
jgi:hypothetical protein